MESKSSQVTNNQELRDDGSISAYFSMMLHIDDDDLDAYEYRLLGHYRKVCGLFRSGKCTEALETTAAACKMGLSTARSARNRLAQKGCIYLVETPGAPTGVTIRNRMPENLQRYTPITSDRPPLSDVIGDIRIQESNTIKSQDAKAPAMEAHEETVKAPKPASPSSTTPPTPSPRKGQPSDVFFKAVALCAYGSEVTYDGKMVGFIMYGNPKLKCPGLIAYECERQGVTRQDLDYAALGRDVQAFWKWLKAKYTNLTALVECNRWYDYWRTWRSLQPQAATPVGEIKLFFDPQANAHYGRRADGQLIMYHAGVDSLIRSDDLPVHLKWMAQGAKQ